MPFVKGQSGNPNGSPGKNKIWPWTASQLKDNVEKAQALVEDKSNWQDNESWFKALMHLITFQADRTYGKPAQSVDLTSGDKPLAAIVNISLSDKPLT